MPKIPSLPAITAPDPADLLPIEDVSVTTTKKITLLQLQQWFQALVGWISTAMIADGAITSAKLATNSIRLGRVTKTTDFTTGSATPVQVTSMTLPVTVPAGGRDVKITATIPLCYGGNSGQYWHVTLWKGTVGSGTLLKTFSFRTATTDHGTGVTIEATDPAPAAGSATYNLGFQWSAGAGTATAGFSFAGTGGSSVGGDMVAELV